MGTRVVSVSVYRPVSFYFLLCHVLQAPLRRMRLFGYPSAPLVNLPCYLSVLQIYNSTYVFDDGRMDSENFDSDKILLFPFRTLVQFHQPKPRRSRKHDPTDLHPERSQRNVNTVLSLIKVTGRFGRVLEATGWVQEPTSMYKPVEHRELYVWGYPLSNGTPAYISTTLVKEELDEVVNRVSSETICRQ